MNIRSRLARLEAAARLQDGPEPDEPADDRGWLERFRQWGEQGLFGHAPDFAAALANYEAAIQDAEGAGDWNPADGFQPGLAARTRLENWRSSRFSAVWTAWRRIADMMEGCRPCPSTPV